MKNYEKKAKNRTRVTNNREVTKYEKHRDFIGKLHWESGKKKSYVFRDS